MAAVCFTVSWARTQFQVPVLPPDPRRCVTPWPPKLPSATGESPTDLQAQALTLLTLPLGLF